MKEKKIKIAVALILSGVFLVIAGKLYLRIEPRIHDKITQMKESHQREKERNMMHDPQINVANLPALKDKPDAWYTKYHVIGHGGGGIDGRTYTNSLEAWNYAYSRGNRVMDADLRFTTDEELVLLHSWNDNLEQTSSPMLDSRMLMDKNGHVQCIQDDTSKTDFKTFMARKIYHLYTPMSCETMLRYMQKHPDLYVATDMKDDVVKSYRYIVNKAKELQIDSVLNRIIVNVYDHSMYDKVMKIYPFPNTTIRQHYVHPNNYYELAEFCLKHNVHVVNVSACYAEDEGIKLLQSKGIHVIIAVVDYISDMQEFRKLGFTGCVSNLLYEDIYHLSEIK